jgi:2-hydroxy-6-oxo-6-(2'-carboxyphenyl)-hexa-2,4-dienoate hydrolase
MIRKGLFTCLAFMLSMIIFSSNLFASDCTINASFMDRGETKVFIICGKDIPRNYTIKGLSEANITIEYEQYLKMCAIGLDTPGIYLVLRAEDNAETASVSLLNADTKEPVCESLSIEIPDRVHIQEASLEDLTDPNLPFKILEIRASQSQELSQACAEGLTFPEGRWPTLSLLSKEEAEEIPPASRSGYALDQPLICQKSSIQALVKIQGQQRYPAKIIISKVRLKGGEEKEGVAHVMLPPPVWSSAMRDEDAKYVDVKGIRTRYFEKGKGDALLLVHEGQAGSTGNAQTWEQNFDYLAQYFHVYAVDRLGQGYTNNPKTDKDYEEYYKKVVGHLYGFIKVMDIEKVHLIGHSQGGWPVTRIALDHPEMVKSLVIVDSGMAPSGPQDWKMTFYMYISFYVDPPGGPNLESVRRGIELWSYAFNNITGEKVQRLYKLMHLPKMVEARKQMRRHNMSPAHPSFQALKNKALEEIEEGKLKVPTLVIWGYNDPSLTPEVGIKLFKCVSSSVSESQLHMFTNCGHHPYIEYPEQFNRLIKSFCGVYVSSPME